MDRVRAIVEKEWAEVFKNRIVLFTVTIVPILLTAIPLGVTGTLRAAVGADPADVDDLPPKMLAACGGIEPGACLEVVVLQNFLIFFLLTPMIIPSTIASYSIVGEKTTRSLEPLLATPITTEELLAGKGIAAALPGIAASWLSYLVFVTGVALVGSGKLALLTVVSPLWLIGVGVVGPLISGLSVTFVLIVSARVNDPRTAEVYTAVLVLPLVALLGASFTGLVAMNVSLLLTMAAVLVVLDVALVYVGARVFRRETILTRWS